MNLNDFDKQARRAEQKVVLQAKEAITAVALDAYHSLQAPAGGGQAGGSPVASGRLAGSTRLELNKIDSSYEPEDPNYDYPSAEVHKYSQANLPVRTIANRPISRIAAKLRTFKLGDTIYISNSVPYIRRVEIWRHSWQTPDGIFEVTIRAVVARFRNIKLRITRG